LQLIDLGLGWSYPCDIWSAGCILVELCTVCLSLSKRLHLYLSILWFLFYKMRLSITGRSFISDSWKFRTSCNDGKGTWIITTAHVEESRVSDLSCETLNWLILKVW